MTVADSSNQQGDVQADGEPADSSARPDAWKTESSIARLRGEASAATDKTRQARLLGEIGELEERAADEVGAARDYLGAFNAEPSFREPLEGLVRLLERRRSLKNLGRLIDALARAAVTPEEKTRALVMRAAFLDDVSTDPEGARAALREATSTGASDVETTNAWLALELLAAKIGEPATRIEALEERAKRPGDPTWQGLLLIDLARLVAESGDTARAFELLEEARAKDAGATFLAVLATERLARSEPGVAGSEEVKLRGNAYASALEAKAEMSLVAMTDGARGTALGVPAMARAATYMVDSWLRAADARRLNGEYQKAADTLNRAHEVVLAGAPGGDPASIDTTVIPPIVNARIRMAELMGDTRRAADLARGRLESEQDSKIAASLAMRIAEQAASEGNAQAALDALSQAVANDPACLPARALQLDLLADGPDAAAFATQLEAFAENLTTDEARGRAYVVAAYAWGVRAGDIDGAKGALSQAGLHGVAPGTLSRIARMIAGLRGESAWHEEATRRLVANGSTPEELSQLWFELLRARSAHGDAEGTKKALSELTDAPGGAWLGNVLEAFLPIEGGDAAPRWQSLEKIAEIEGNPDLARGLYLVVAMHTHASGDLDGTRTRLRALAEKEPADPIVATYLADIERASGAHAAAAEVLTACALATTDPSLAGALHLEAGFSRWRAGERKAALDAFEAAGRGASAPARTAFAWAARGVDVDSLEARRRVLAVAIEGGEDAGSVALERFATEVCGGDSDAVRDALSVLEQADGDLATAGALARLVWPESTEDPERLDAAIARLAAAGASQIAAAEQLRRARQAEPALAVEAAQRWFDAGAGLAAGIEWVAAAMSEGSFEREVEAWKAIASVLEGEARDAVTAGAAMLNLVAAHGSQGLIAGDSDAIRLVNLDLAPPGSDPRRRAAALRALNGALGDNAQLDALGLAGWSLLAAGDFEAAKESFLVVTKARVADLAGWEGLRAAAEALEDKALQARAASQLGARCADSRRGAAFWEEAAHLRNALGQSQEAEDAFNASFARDAHRAVAFDKLFRRVREKKDADRLLAIIERRLEVTEDPTEIGKLYWEQARVLREKGDVDGALTALENVTMIEPEHVGALALTGEIFIRRGQYEEAATNLAKLATISEAPAKNRVTAGIAAVDLYENKLDQYDKALEVLIALHRAKLSTLPVRERLARAAARVGSWKEATAILEELMNERPEPQGRIEAARLSIAIHRDRLNDARGAAVAILKLLEESPGDGEALDMLLELEKDTFALKPILLRAKDAILLQLKAQPIDLAVVQRLARIAHALKHGETEYVALSTSIAIGESTPQIEQKIAQFVSRKPRFPQIAMTEPLLRSLLAAGDEGPIAQLFTLLAPTLAEALGPSLAGLGVTKRDKVEARSGLALRNEIASWAGCFGINDFDLYVGGKDPKSVQAVPGEIPSLVVGAGANAPLSPVLRGAIARELCGLVRGTTILRSRDETTIAAIVVAACRIVDVRVDAPPYAVLAEVEKLMSKAISRKTKKLIPDICKAIVSSGQDAKAWSKRGLMSLARAQLLASGDVAFTLSDLLGAPIEQARGLAKSDERAAEIVRFVLSPSYIELRRTLGLEEES